MAFDHTLYISGAALGLVNDMGIEPLIDTLESSRSP